MTRPTRARRPRGSPSRSRARASLGRYWSTIECTTTVAMPGQREGEAIGDPRVGVGSIDRGGHPPRHLDGRLEAGEALHLVGPHVRHQGEAALGRGGVERVAVAPAALGHLEPGREVGRVALPHPGEAHRAVRVAAHHPPGVVGEVVPAQVQPGAGADLEDPQRERGAMGDRRRTRPPARPSGPPRWSARRPRCSSAISASCSSTVARNVAARSGPSRAARRRVVGGERRRPALEHDPVDRTEEAQRQRGAERDPRRGRRGAEPTRRRPAGRRPPRRARGRTAATPTARRPPPGTRRRR